MLRLLLVASLSCGIVQSAHSATQTHKVVPDFVLALDKCNVLVASTASPGSIKDTVGDGALYLCQRKSRKMNCEIRFKNGEAGHKGNQIVFDISAEAGGTTLMHANQGGDYIQITAPTHSAITITRMLGEEITGTKLCSGFYLTWDEYQALEKSLAVTK